MTDAPSELDTTCPCGGTHRAEVRTAAHDTNLVDLVISCDSCDRQLNAFLNIKEDFVLVERAE